MDAMQSHWYLVILASVIGSLFSLMGGMLLLSKRFSVSRVQRAALPFAAGGLLAAAFFDLLPEAFEASSPLRSSTLVLGGFLVFFMFERFLGWFHHHHTHTDDGAKAPKNGSTKFLVVVGDILHNSIDGLLMGAAFLVSPATGIVTTFAIAVHEVPKEVGNFGVLLALGMRRRNVLLANLAAALATVIATVLVYGFGGVVGGLQPVLLALTAGMFIYIAASDLIPTIHEERDMRVANLQTFILLLGIVAVGFAVVTADKLLK